MAKLFGVEKLASDLAIRAADDVRCACAGWMMGDTPIEKLFMTAFWFELRHRHKRVWIDTEDMELAPPDAIVIEVQKVIINQWPVDFYISVTNAAGGRSGIVVECDGHDFHERTKEQAARDRSRDRELQTLGHMVFRFTGSEIYRDPLRCANEVADQVNNYRFGKGDEE